MKLAKLLIVLCVVFLQVTAHAQKKQDSIVIKNDSISLQQHVKDSTAKKDTVIKSKHNPRKATLYSAILPGAGQVYNKKYWKLPLVYAAIGIPTYTFFYNKKWYQKCQYALKISATGGTAADSAKVDVKLRPLVDAGVYGTSAIINYRNEFRKDQDYSALFFLIFWGLNIIDATVDAHLKDFNVNNDLSFHIKPSFVPGPGVMGGVSLVFDIHKGKTKLIDLNN